MKLKNCWKKLNDKKKQEEKEKENQGENQKNIGNAKHSEINERLKEMQQKKERNNVRF